MSIDPFLVYSSNYNIRFGGLEKLHPFDSCKFERAFDLVRASGIRSDRVIEPAPAELSDLLLVHTPAYLDRLKHSSYVAQVLELPFLSAFPAALVSKYVLSPMLYATGGTLLAAQAALAQGAAVNLGGGYHHASRDRGAGFCVYADVPIAISALRKQGQRIKAIIVDLDAHQGNGFERIHETDADTKIFDVYNASAFPLDLPARRGITWEVPVRPGTGDEDYLTSLKETLPRALDEWQPDLAFFIAGTDVFRGDPLGGLSLSADGIFARDRLVFDELTARGIPWVMVLGGGYTRQSYQFVARSVSYVFEQHGHDRRAANLPYPTLMVSRESRPS